MKKFFDRYLFSRMGLQILVSIVALMLFSMIVTFIKENVTADDGGAFFSRLSWGFRYVANGASITKTLEQLDSHAYHGLNIFVLLVITFISWAVGLTLCGFVTGAIVNAFHGRRIKISSGQTRYKFKNHGIILGWDYQGVAVVKNMLDKWQLKEVLVVSEKPSPAVLAALKLELEPSEISRVYIYNCAINVEENIRELQAEFARVIVILGEENSFNKDGETIHAEQILRKYVGEKITDDRVEQFANLPIKLFLHIEDPILYTQARAQETSIIQKKSDSQEKNQLRLSELFDVELSNFYESWAWQCWSKVGTVDSNGAEYLPLRCKSDSENVELFVIGSNAMGYAFVNYAITLMNYGKDHKHCKVTLFDEKSSGARYLPEEYVASQLPEVEVVHELINGTSARANEIMFEAISRGDTSVTIVIADPEVDEVIKAYCGLSYKIRRTPVSVLVWQKTQSTNCIDKSFLKFRGDQTQLRYFGMTDILPWADESREEYGRKVDFYYGVVTKLLEKENLPQKVSADKMFELLDKALQIPCDPEAEKRSAEEWNSSARWERWSSINAGDSFKEKQNAFPDCLENPVKCMDLIKSEHNRWWTERLLTGWIYSDKKDAKLFLHPNLVKTEELDAKTQAIDLINILAMKDVGLLKKNK